MNKAAHITTIEYGIINSTVKEIDTLTPIEAAKNFLKGSFAPVDFVITYSSLEHSGLGRYGDSLNPYGDLEAAAQIWCMLKPGGLLFLGLPYDSTGSRIEFNAHRIYGPERMKHIASSFEQLDFFDPRQSGQILFTLRKPKK